MLCECCKREIKEKKKKVEVVETKGNMVIYDDGVKRNKDTGRIVRDENDLTGFKFGKLTVMELAESDSVGGLQWLCLCECGETKKIRARNLKSGQYISCGCLNPNKKRSEK